MYAIHKHEEKYICTVAIKESGISVNSTSEHSSHRFNYCSVYTLLSSVTVAFIITQMTVKSRRVVLKMKVPGRSDRHFQVTRSGINHDTKPFSLYILSFKLLNAEMNYRKLMKHTYVKKLTLPTQKSEIEQAIRT
jgi:hypothetical protein